MAIVTRYFSTAAAGSGDGTSWANRALLFSSGNWSSVVTGFTFSGSDTLVGVFGPGSYTSSQTLASGLFSAAPSTTNRLFFRPCDSSGNLVRPASGYKSDSGAITTTDMPFISHSGGRCINLANVAITGLRIEGSANDAVVAQLLSIDNCYIASTGSGSSTSAAFRVYSIKNSHLYCSGTSYSSVVLCDENIPLSVTNTRVQGVIGTASNRRGISIDAFAPSLYVTDSAILTVGGVGIYAAGQQAGDNIINNIVYGCGSHGIQVVRSTTSATGAAHVTGNVVVGNGGYGLNQSSSVGMLAHNNRLRDNASGNFNGFGNYPTDLDNYTTDADDAADFVNSGAGNYQIKSTAGFVNRNIGVSQEVAASGGLRRVFSGGVF